MGLWDGLLHGTYGTYWTYGTYGYGTMGRMGLWRMTMGHMAIKSKLRDIFIVNVKVNLLQLLR